MAIKHNQQLVKNHFRKDWQRRVRCHFDQPGKKVSRRNHRQARAAKLAPRPVDSLRPVVRCPSVKYNRKVRAGRGFAFVELKEAGIPRKLASTIGISVDHRRVNLSTESLTANVARLKAYKERLILFPRRNGAHKKTDASKEDVKSIKEKNAAHIRSVLPIINHDLANAISGVSRSELPTGEEAAYVRLRTERANARFVGVREKRALAKAEAEGAKK